MDIPDLVLGTLGIGATIAIGAFGIQASTPGEYWLARGLFIVSALLLGATVFAAQWMADRPISLMRVFGTGFVGFIIFAGLAACLDWVKRKETAHGSEPGIVARPSNLQESTSKAIDTPQPDAAKDSAARQAIRDAVPKETEVEKKVTLRPLIVTFRDGRAQVGLAVNYHIEPAEAPLMVVSVGDPSRVTEVLIPRATSTALAVLEPLSLTEARTRRLELEREIGEQLRVEFKKIGITIDSVSLTEIEPR